MDRVYPIYLTHAEIGAAYSGLMAAQHEDFLPQAAVTVLDKLEVIDALATELEPLNATEIMARQGLFASTEPLIDEDA